MYCRTLFIQLRLAIFLFLLPAVSHTKTYDCFCNEFELLVVRLEELWDNVDYFVLVESIETQKGDPKPLYFEENRSRFEKYLSKIISIPIREQHPEFDAWERENYQRNCIMHGLSSCRRNDVILISDLDEIPRSSLLPEIVHRLTSHDRPRSLEAIGLQQSIYFYQINRQTPTKETWGGGLWIGTTATNYATLQRKTPQYFRDRRGQFPCIFNAGWLSHGWEVTMQYVKRCGVWWRGTPSISVDRYLHRGKAFPTSHCAHR